MGFRCHRTALFSYQRRVTSLLNGIEFGLHLLNVEHLSFKQTSTVFNLFQKALQLLSVAVAGVIHAYQFAALGQREADTLTSQNQFETDPVAAAVHAFLPPAHRSEHVLLFVKSNGASGDAELARKIRNAVSNDRVQGIFPLR
ncbi:hypothetical protein D3C85_295310 [compost metagenome]